MRIKLKDVTFTKYEDCFVFTNPEDIRQIFEFRLPTDSELSIQLRAAYYTFGMCMAIEINP